MKWFAVYIYKQNCTDSWNIFHHIWREIWYLQVATKCISISISKQKWDKLYEFVLFRNNSIYAIVRENNTSSYSWKLCSDRNCCHGYDAHHSLHCFHCRIAHSHLRTKLKLNNNSFACRRAEFKLMTNKSFAPLAIWELKQGRGQWQQRQKTMIWLVQWGKIIVRHVWHALYISTILWCRLPNDNMKFPNLRF